VAVKTTSVREFRYFLNKIRVLKGLSYRALAEKMCRHTDPGMLADLVDRRTRQLEHFFNDPDDGDPRASLARAIEEALESPALPAADYGWDPSKP